MGTIGAVKARVIAAAGVAVLPSYFVKDDLEQGRLVQLHSKVKLHHDFFRLIWHEDQAQPSALQCLTEELRQLVLT